MPEITRNGPMISIGDDIRIEPGPAKITAKATEALLGNDQTAAHYQADAIDAHGDPIKIGKPMVYLDWNAHREGNSIWYLSRQEKLSDAECKERGCEKGSTIFRDAGQFDSEDAALAAAFDLIGAE